MKRTKIDWCDSTWNPVTGCLHGCEYCYARRIAERFGAHLTPTTAKFQVLNERVTDYMGKKEPYPFGFLPTFHRYKLDEPARWTKPRTIFVCSMADLFGSWVPDEWIKEVLDACRKAPQHRFLFLTKNPTRYYDMYEKGMMDMTNFWFGTSVTEPGQEYFHQLGTGSFVSMEPLLKPFTDEDRAPVLADWIILGAETGNRKGKVIPQKQWIDAIVRQCDANSVPVFMKESLRAVMGDDFRQEFPWGVKF